jgi:hypothetical protein
MSENTNNSLSDLNNEEHKFNRLLKDDDITKNKNQSNKVSDLNSENNAFRSKVQNSNNVKEKDTLNKKIGNNQNKIDKINTNDFAKGNEDTYGGIPTSLFDRNAMIDYGRFVNTDGSVKANWKEYNKANNEYILNNNSPINQPVLFKDNSLFSANNASFSNEGLSITNLITWSEKYPALQLRYQDFVYCKKIGYYPNNRLVVLRRFKGGVPDNLFDYYRKDTTKVEFTQPLATMITWLKPDEEIVDMSFNEEWTEYNVSFIETIKNSVNSFISGATTENTKTTGDGFEDLLTSLSLDAVSEGFGDKYQKEDGIPFSRSSVGNPNLIKKAMKRKTGGDGIKSEISFKLSFEYELRYINEIDPSIALLDLMSNAMRMGTSESEFKYNIPLVKESDLVKSFINGDISKATEMFEKNINLFTKDISKTVSDLINGVKTTVKKVTDKGVQDVLKNSLSYIVSRYREDLKASLSVDTGLPSGIWHVTIGNPKSPIVSCGDLIIKNSTLKLGKEIGYNDFPNSFEIIYVLESARPRGRNELIRIFNSGRGRLYVYKNHTQNPDYDLYDSSDTKK